jgi:hypothetical protein
MSFFNLPAFKLLAEFYTSLIAEQENKLKMLSTSRISLFPQGRKLKLYLASSSHFQR